MKLPCGGCSLDKPAGEYVRGECRLCWLVVNRKDYARLFRVGPKVRCPAAVPCVHLGEPTGDLIPCKTCRGEVKLKLFACAVFGTCTIGKKVNGTACCAGEKGKPCPGYEPKGSHAAN